MRESQQSSFDGDDDRYNQDNFKKKIRYYTPQPFNRYDEDHRIDKVNKSFINRAAINNVHQSNRDSGYRSDQQNEARTVTCFKGTFEPKKILQGALRTRSILRGCYAPNRGTEYKVKISPMEDNHANRQLPGLPCITSTTNRFKSDDQNLLKHFATFSNEAFQNGSLFGLEKQIKERPKFDDIFDLKYEFNNELYDASSLSSGLVSKAGTESKNFLYDVYLRKAEDSLDEFENKREKMNISECSRLLDRCIEFYELAMKTLDGDKNSENTKILLRAKQSKAILKKRHLWKVKSSLTQRPSPFEKECHCRNYYNYKEIESNPATRCKEESIVNHEKLHQLRSYSAIACRTSSVSSVELNSKARNCRSSESNCNCTAGSTSGKIRYNRSTSLNDTFQPRKIMISLNKDHSNDDQKKRKNICIGLSNASLNSIHRPPITKIKPVIVDGVMEHRRKLPNIPETKNQSSIDVTSRTDRFDQSFVKISLV